VGVHECEPPPNRAEGASFTCEVCRDLWYWDDSRDRWIRIGKVPPGPTCQEQRSFRLSIEEATSADEALGIIAAALPEDLMLSRMGLRTDTPDPDQVMTVAIWSRGPSMLFPGLSHPRTGPLGGLYDVVLQTGRPDRRELGEGTAPVVESILLGEGHRSVVQVPLSSPAGQAVLTFMSSRHGAFSDEDVGSLAALCAANAPRLVQLAKEASKRLLARSIPLPEGLIEGMGER
jgi:hypothetical protein